MADSNFTTELERFVPSEVQGAIALEHWHRYVFASQFVKGAVTLDLACGDGYGSEFLARTAAYVHGMDISAPIIDKAKRSYSRSNLHFAVASCERVPLEDGSVDVIVSFETIEHHDAHAAMLQEFKRVLKPSGLLIISSPDKAEYSDRRSYRNPFHVKELHKDEFRALLEERFRHVELLGQRIVGGSIIVPESGLRPATRHEITGGGPSGAECLAPLYWLGMASEEPLPEAVVGLLESERVRTEASTKHGRNPTLTRIIDSVAIAESSVLRHAIDGDWYRQNNPDVFTESVDPHVHWREVGSIEGRVPSSDPHALVCDLLTERIECAEASLREALNRITASHQSVAEALRARECAFQGRLDALRGESEAERLRGEERVRVQLAEASAREQRLQTELDALRAATRAQERALMDALRQRDGFFQGELEALVTQLEHARNLHAELTGKLESRTDEFVKNESGLRAELATLTEQLEAALREKESALLKANRERDEFLDLLRGARADMQRARDDAEGALAHARAQEQLMQRQLARFEEISLQDESERKNLLEALRQRDQGIREQLVLMEAEVERERERGLRALQAQAADHARQKSEMTARLGGLRQRVAEIENTWTWRLGALLSPSRITSNPLDEYESVKDTVSPQSSGNRAPSSVSELLAASEEEFVRWAYVSILGREPDAEGYSHYLSRLCGGDNRLDILWSLSMSQEGKSSKSRLNGLAAAIRRVRLRRWPFVGYILRATDVRQNLRDSKTALAAQVGRLQIELAELKSKHKTAESALRSVAEFDPAQYLALNEDVAAAGANPYEHYIRFGFKERRQTSSLKSRDEIVHSAQWLERRRPVSEDTEIPPVDIILPVFNGYDFLEPLFRSVLANTRAPYRLIIVDDASTDPRVASILCEYAKKLPNTVLVRNSENQGFIHSVNRGFALVQAEFCVLLNSDTEVPSGWLGRLIRPLQCDPKIATATPFSNAATICSFPDIAKDNLLFMGLPVEQIDRAFSAVGASIPAIDIPTGVGFCMAMRVSVLRQIGAFDHIYGRGYGEENDWCMRARALGYRHALVPNLFVYHKHGGSFQSEEKAKLIRANLQTLSSRYPDYHELVRGHIALDPAAGIREFVKLLLLSESRGGATLIVDHNLGGGANSFRKQLVRFAIDAGRPAIVLFPVHGKDGRLQLNACMPETEARFTVPTLEMLSVFLKVISIREVVYNNIVGVGDPLAVIGVLAAHIKTSSIPLTVMVHDFYPVCASYTLINRHGRYCGVPTELETCKSCVTEIPKEYLQYRPERWDIASWRGGWRDFMGLATEIRCFSQSSKDIVERAYPDLAPKCTVVPHCVEFKPSRLPRVNRRGELCVGVVGGINYAKGRAVVQELSTHIKRSSLAHKLFVIGETDVPMDGVTVTGRYDVSQLGDILEELGINVVLIPSIWPETFSYVTAEVMALQMPLACFDIGAPAERVRQYSKGRVIDDCDPASILTALAELALDEGRVHPQRKLA